MRAFVDVSGPSGTWPCSSSYSHGVRHCRDRTDNSHARCGADVVPCLCYTPPSLADRLYLATDCEGVGKRLASSAKPLPVVNRRHGHRALIVPPPIFVDVTIVEMAPKRRFMVLPRPPPRLSSAEGTWPTRLILAGPVRDPGEIATVMDARRRSDTS